MQCSCLSILLGVMMKTVNMLKNCSWTSMLSLSQDKWLGNDSSHELSSNTHLLHNYFPASLPLVPLQDPTTFILNSELERPQSHLQWEFLNNRIISMLSPALYFHPVCLSLLQLCNLAVPWSVPCRAEPSNQAFTPELWFDTWRHDICLSQRVIQTTSDWDTLREKLPSVLCSSGSWNHDAIRMPGLPLLKLYDISWTCVLASRWRS